MLVKKENNFFKYFKFVLMFLVLVFIYFYSAFFTNFILYLPQKFFNLNNTESLTQTEREELASLRIENKILQDEVDRVRNEFSVGIIDEKKSPVYMLLGESSLYGDFYISKPVDKTPYKGMNIFSNGNIVVGQVEEILNNSLKVSRLGQGKSFIASTLEDEESLELRSLGSGLYVGNVSGGSKIKVDDTVVLKGYPKAVVGKVVEVGKTNTSLSNIFVQTPYNISNKQIFYVIQ
jgi:hypothetical protein